MSDNVIPPGAVCAGCSQTRDEHSGGSFLCPDTGSTTENRFQFTDAEFTHADA